MAETKPDDSSGPLVGRLARSLLACAKDQPSLLVRSPAAADRALPSLVAELPGLIAELPRSQARQAGLMFGPVNRATDRSRYLEELVSIAVSTAHQADDAARRASEACAMARRDRFAWAGFGILGIVIGISGVVDAHWLRGMSSQPVAVADYARLAEPSPGNAGDAAGSVASATPASPALQATTAAPSPRASTPPPFESSLPAAIPIAARPNWSIGSTAPLARGEVAPSSSPPAPRPKYRTQRNHHVNVTRHRPVVLAQFFATLRRDVRAIFQ
jgi:hypothetical protein